MAALCLCLAGFAFRFPDDVDGLATGAVLLDEVEISLCLLAQLAVSPPRVEGAGGLVARSPRRAARLRVEHEVPTRSGGLALPPWGTVEMSHVGLGITHADTQARVSAHT